MVHLKKALSHFISTDPTDVISNMAISMTADMRNRCAMLDGQVPLYFATFLDPRFKARGFYNPDKYRETKAKVEQAVGRLCAEEEPQPATTATAPSSSSVNGIDDMWAEFDREHSRITADRRPSCSATLEVRQYIEQLPISRKEDPLLYWKKHELTYPRLAKLAKRHLCIMATSTPSERVFSTAGQVVSAKRSRLTTKNVEKIIFMNKNMDHFDQKC